MTATPGPFTRDQIAEFVADLGLPADGMPDSNGKTVEWHAPAADLLGEDFLPDGEGDDYTVFEALTDQAGAAGLGLAEYLAATQ